MASRKQGRWWRLFRIYFRRFRICSWLVILALAGALLYLNQIGLPDFVKRPLLEKLHARGIDLQFSRLRLHFYRGIVADNVLFGRADDAATPKLSLKEVQVRIDYHALLKRQVQVRSLLLRQGRLTWPIIQSNQPPRELIADNIRSELRFLPGDLWQLEPFQATFAGARLQLFVTLTNATAMRDWKFFQPGEGPQPRRAARLQEDLRQLAEVLEQIHFAVAPQLNLQIYGDAEDLASFGAQLRVRAPAAESPWGAFSGGALMARVIPAKPPELPSAEIFLSATNASTHWARASHLELVFHAFSEKGGTDFNANLDLAAAWAASSWGDATNVHFTSQWLHSPTNSVPLSGRGGLRASRAVTRWGSATGLSITGWLSTPTNPPAPPNPAWGFWTSLAPYELNLDGRADRLDSAPLSATNILCAAMWRAPQLGISRLSANLYDGSLVASGNLNVDTRAMSFSQGSDFDVQQVSTLLPPAGRRWLSQFSWENPPKLDAEARLILPAWTNRSPDWRAEVEPTLKLRGQAAVGPGAFRQVPFDSAAVHFTYTNRLWTLPDLAVTRPEGRVTMFLQSDERTQDYYLRLQSTIDPNAIRPLLSTNQLRGFDLAGFSQPPVIAGEIWGRWQDSDRIGVKASVSVTNFTFRGETATGLQSKIEYTNQLIKFINPRLQRGNEHAAISGVSVDLTAQKIYLSNAVTTMDPQVVARAIGPIAGRWFEPYHFLDVPSGQVDGSLSFDIKKGVDLHFTVNGGAFEWWKFRVPRITGQVDWVDNRLALRGVHAEFYRGEADGGAEFDFSPLAGNDLRFDVGVTNADLHQLMHDLSPDASRLAGSLAGRLAITDGNTADPLTWRGHGHANLRDGVIWEIPAVGIFSYMLDSLSTGLGSSRASQGSATFVVTNGLVRSEDLEVRASTMRMKYRGEVGFDGKLNALVEAELLRDTWIVGRLLSLALWPVSKVFEYKVTGTLAEPKVEPLLPVIPKLILLPLHPLDAMKELLPKPPDATKTNAPPAKP